MIKLSDSDRRLARKIAANNWNKSAKHARDWDARRKLAERWTRDDIRAQKDGFGGPRGAFSSVLVTILIGLAVRFAVFLIIKWWEGELFEVNPYADDVNE